MKKIIIINVFIVYKPFINNHNTIKREVRRKLHLATLLFVAIKKSYPTYLYERIDWTYSHFSYSIKPSAIALSMPGHRTAAFCGSFKYAATRCWNSTTN